MSVYESDGLTAYRQLPLVVVLPKTTAEVAKVLHYAFQNRIKIVPRGAGTSLSGGALPLADGIVLGLSKFNQILEIDYDNRCAVVQPGVTNLAITQRCSTRASTMRRTPPRRSPAPSAAMWRKIPAGCIALNTASPPTTSLALKWC